MMGNVTDKANNLVNSTGDWVQKYADANDSVIRQGGKTYVDLDLVRAVNSQNDRSLGMGVMALMSTGSPSSLVAAVTSSTLVTRAALAQLDKGDLGLAEVRREATSAMEGLDNG